MERIDPQMAARVWQRVQAAAAENDTSGRTTQRHLPEKVLPELKELIARLWVDAALCRQLMRMFRGSDRAALDSIARQKRAGVARLKGILAMQTDTRPVIPAPPVPRGTREQQLRHCCDGTAHCATQLQQLTADPRYGSDYAAMAEQVRRQHRQLLGLLGK